MGVGTIGARSKELDSDRQAKPEDGTAVIVESGPLSSRMVNCPVLHVLAPRAGLADQCFVCSTDED